MFDFIKKIINPILLPAELKEKYIALRCEEFNIFFRYTLGTGILVYFVLIIVDWFTLSALFFDVISIRLMMLVAFFLTFFLTFLKTFINISNYVAIVFILLLMLNITWTQAIIEAGLEEGYGLLITPDTTSSVIVFSGAEVGYGSLLIPLLLLPIAFTALQAFFIATIAVIIINVGMTYSELPSAFVETINAVLIGIGFFITVFAYLITQQRRYAFMLSHNLEMAKNIAENSLETKKALVATISHEVRNFVNGILGLTHKLEDANLNVSQQESISTLQYSGETLLIMLNDTLDLSKMESGKLTLDYNEIDLKKLVTSLIELMKSRAEENNTKIFLVINSNVPNYIYSDSTRLRQILLNLISNAIKFTKDGFITVNIKSTLINNDKHLLRFEIVDTGIGISREAKNKIFNAYNQASTKTSKQYGGTGLGLSICEEIVSILGGQIGVESKVGRGSTFWVQWPTEIIKTPVMSENVEISLDTQGIQPMHILLAEDDDLIAGYMKDVLEIKEHTVTIAKDGEEAVTMAASNIYEVILLDYNMPKLSGVEVTKLIRASDMNAITPIIALTAVTEEKIIQSFKSAGVNDYLLKPIHKNDLFQAINKYVISSHSKDHNVVPNGLQSIVDDFGEEYANNMLKNFIDRIDEKIIALENGLASDNHTEIVVAAHDITSMSGLVGFLKTCDAFRAIERQARSNELDDIRDLFTAAKNIYKSEKKK